MPTITIPFEFRKMEQVDAESLLRMDRNLEIGIITTGTFDLDRLDEDELQLLGMIAATACPNPDTIIALGLEIEARMHPETAEQTAAGDPAIEPTLVQQELQASAA